jgi:hypothetical protein
MVNNLPFYRPRYNELDDSPYGLVARQVASGGARPFDAKAFSVERYRPSRRHPRDRKPGFLTAGGRPYARLHTRLKNGARRTERDDRVLFERSSG